VTDCEGRKLFEMCILKCNLSKLSCSRMKCCMRLCCSENDLEIVLPTEADDVDVDSSSVGNVCFDVLFSAYITFTFNLINMPFLGLPICCTVDEVGYPKVNLWELLNQYFLQAN